MIQSHKDGRHLKIYCDRCKKLIRESFQVKKGEFVFKEYCDKILSNPDQTEHYCSFKCFTVANKKK